MRSNWRYVPFRAQLNLSGFALFQGGCLYGWQNALHLKQRVLLLAIKFPYWIGVTHNVRWQNRVCPVVQNQSNCGSMRNCGGEECMCIAQHLHCVKILKILETIQLWEHQSAEGDSVPHRKCIEDGERRSGRSRRGPRQCSFWYPYWLIEHMVDSAVLTIQCPLMCEEQFCFPSERYSYLRVCGHRPLFLLFSNQLVLWILLNLLYCLPIQDVT